MITLTTLLVRDYDEAIAFYVDAIGFELREDSPRADGGRWVVVGPKDGVGLLLARPGKAEQVARIGDQTGGRVGWFLQTEDFPAQYARMVAAGVRFLEEPRHEPYGTVAVFADLYGNRWDLIQPSAAPTPS